MGMHPLMVWSGRYRGKMSRSNPRIEVQGSFIPVAMGGTLLLSTMTRSPGTSSREGMSLIAPSRNTCAEYCFPSATQSILI